MFKSLLEFLKTKRGMISAAVAVAAIGLLLLLKGMVVEIPPQHIGVVYKKMGKSLPAGEIIAPDDSYQGVQLELLKTGWHMVNPIGTEVRLHPSVFIPEGRKGLINRRIGSTPKNPDDILVDEGERGYQRALLEPGVHYLHPQIFDVEVIDPVVIPARHVGVVTSHVGKRAGTVVVEEGEKGVQRELLTPGTYWLNPKGYSVEVFPAVEIPKGSVGVVTSLSGKPGSDDLVEEGQKGILRKVLSSGTHYINPRAYEVTIEPAVRIEAGFVGVVVAMTGKKPENPNAIIVADGERGVQPYTLPAGLYNFNPYEFKVTTVDSRVQKYEMSSGTENNNAASVVAMGEVVGDDRLTFPSADGFAIRVDASIEWQIQTDRIPFVIATIGSPDQIVTKIIRPNAREIGRLEGSKLKAEDFIKGDKREQFVVNFSQTLKERCEEKGIIIHKALVREVEPPEEIASPLKEREKALLMQQTNEEKKREAISEASLAEERSKIEQKRSLILAETARKVAETEALREKDVARIKAEQLREVADIERQQQQLILEKQRLEADGIRELADADAHRARELILADGALDKKLSAWTEVMTVWAANPNLVPGIIVGGGGGAGGTGGGSLTGQELVMQLMALEYLDRFAKTPTKPTPLPLPPRPPAP
jgi:regulator of protease activity HflC (stomatin/prohibitin superfamily)